MQCHVLRYFGKYCWYSYGRFALLVLLIVLILFCFAKIQVKIWSSLIMIMKSHKLKPSSTVSNGSIISSTLVICTLMDWKCQNLWRTLFLLKKLLQNLPHAKFDKFLVVIFVFLTKLLWNVASFNGSFATMGQSDELYQGIYEQWCQVQGKNFDWIFHCCQEPFENKRRTWIKEWTILEYFFSYNIPLFLF